jgi:hypothetical protein
MKRIIIFFATLLIAYLSGAFYSASFNIADWEEVSRGTVVIFGLFVALAASSFPFIEEIFK